jgi:hypothetical protein
MRGSFLQKSKEDARLLHGKGRIELLHGEEFGIKMSAYPGAQSLMIIVVRIAKSL